MKLIPLLFLILISLFFTVPLKAEFSNKLFSPVIYPANANERLLNKNIIELAQDQQGFIWVGTRIGLFRYDGYDYKKILFPNEAFDFGNIYVRALLVDGDNLWIGSMSDGMFHLDLKNFQITQYLHNNQLNASIAGNQVNDFALDKQGALWVAHSFGLDRFDKKQQSFFHFRSSENTEERYFNYLLEAEFDHQGRLWLSTGKGLALFNAKEGAFKRVFQSVIKDHKKQAVSQQATLKDVMVRKIFVAQDGKIWLATHRKGTFIIDLTGANFQSANIQTASFNETGSNEANLKKTNFEQSLEIENAVITRLKAVDSKKLKMNTAIAQPSKDEIWISGSLAIEIRDAKTGALIKSLKSNLLDQYGLSNDIVYSMLVSRSGLLWLGVRDSGLHYFNPQNHAFKRINSYLPQLKKIFDGYITQVLRLSEHEVLVVSSNQLLKINFTSGETAPLISNQTLKPNEFTSAVLLENGSIFLGSASGELYHYSLKDKSLSNIVIPLNKQLTEGITILESSASGLWIAQTNRLYHLDLNTLKFEAVVNQDGSQYVNFIKVLMVDKKNQLWIGTTSGLGFIKSNSLQVNLYSKEVNTQETLSNNYINQIIEDVHGRIIINTRSGIYLLVEQKSNQNKGQAQTKNQTQPQQLLFKPFAQNATNKITHDEMLFSSSDSSYWLGSRFHLDENGDVLAEYGIADGLLKKQKGKSILSIANDSILYAALDILVFNPKKIQPWVFKPTIVITELMVDNQPMLAGSVNKGIHLLPSDNGFSVRFSSLDFSRPSENRYRYKLEGYDNDWVETSVDLRFAKYNSLTPGHYTLVLDGSNRKGVWSNNPLRIDVRIDAKFYQTFWFKLAMLLLVLICFYLLLQWRLKNMQMRERKEYEKREAIQKAEMMTELMQQKNKMLAEVTHDLRTPLTTIKMQLEALEDGALEHSEKSYNSLQKKLGNLNQMVGDLYQLSLVETATLALNKQDILIQPVLLEAVEAFKPLANRANLNIHYVSTLNHSVEISADSGRLSQVFNNLLKNAIRYTDPDGEIQVQILTENNELLITFEDSSPGVEDKDLNLIFNRSYRVQATRHRSKNGTGLGLSIVNSIIEAHDGKVSAGHSHLGGVKIVIKLPIIS